jgi:serine/threonine-protein kinase RsbW
LVGAVLLLPPEQAQLGAADSMTRKRPRRRSAKDDCGFDRQDLILRFWQIIPSTVKAVDRVIARILRVARTMGCARGELDKVELALREALNNAVVHASRGDSKKKVTVCCLCTKDKGMLLVVRDHGPGFDPSKVPDPTTAKNIYSGHGRGIFIMRQLMDEVWHEEGGRKVVMKKAAASPRRTRSA